MNKYITASSAPDVDLSLLEACYAQRWVDIIGAGYSENDIERKCIYGLALINTGNIDDGVSLVREILSAYKPSKIISNVIKNNIKILIEDLQYNNNSSTIPWSIKNIQKNNISVPNKLASSFLNDLIILIPTCKKNYHKSQGARVTWVSQIKNMGGRYLFVCGDPIINSPIIVGDTLHIPVKDDYESLLVKISKAYEYILSKFQPKYILKIDDDCYLNVNNFIEKIKNFPHSEYIGFSVSDSSKKINDRWHFGKCTSKKFELQYPVNRLNYSYAKGGYGYFLSNGAARIIVDNLFSYLEDLENNIYTFEDIKVGETLLRHGIMPNQFPNTTISKFNKNIEITSNCDVFYDLDKFSDYLKIENYLSSCSI